MERELGVEGAFCSPSHTPLPLNTPTRAETLRSDAAHAAGRWLPLALLSALLPACSAPSAPHRAMDRQCLEVDGRRETTLTVPSPEAGLLIVTVEERGLTVSARLDDSSRPGSSPVDRLGSIALAATSSAGQTHTLRVRSEDSRDLKGLVCASAEVVPASEPELRHAADALARAAQAVHERDWDAAFAHYQAAARSYDHLALPRRAAPARQSMAELAYRRFDRKRDSYALVMTAMNDYGDAAGPLEMGSLAALQAKALMDMPGVAPADVAPAVRARLAAAQRHFRSSAFGARELPRLDIVLGSFEFGLDAPVRTTELYQAAARRCRELRDWDCYGIASQNLALLAEERNNYAFALSVYTDALHSVNPDLNPKLVADIQDNLGHLQGAMGMFSASERTHAAAMLNYARLGDCPGYRRTLSRTGSLLVQIGTLGDAESDLGRAASLDCPSLLAAAGTAAEAATTGSGREQACRHPINAESLGVENKLVVFSALLSLGDALSLEGELVRAEACIESASPYATTARARMRLANARGSVFLEHGDASAARASFEQTLRIADDAGVPAGNEHRGSARLGVVKAELLSGDAQTALRSGIEALQSSVARADIDQTITSLRLVASAYRNSGRSGDAARALRAALSLSEAVPIDELDGEKRATYLATQHTVFAELTELLAVQTDSGDADAWRAFTVSERGRARSLRYAESQETRDAASGLEAPPSARYQQLLHDVVQLADAKSAGTPAALIDMLGAAADRYGSGAETLERTRLEQTLQRLDATLVEYAVGPRDLLAFILDSGRLSVVRLGSRAEVASAAADLRERLRDSESPAAEVRVAAERLARLVLWPLRGQISRQRLILVPDDALHTIPFSVLPWSSDPKAPLVVEQTETDIAPSALFLTRPHQATAPPRGSARIELIGDPVFRISDWRRECLEGKAASTEPAVAMDRAMTDWSESLPRLPGTRAEVSMIAKLARQSLPGSHVDALLGCAAVASGLRGAVAAGTDLLHIATHARVDAQRPRLSALALTPDGTARPATSAFGLLDILGLKLNSRLVVLSACDTSRGKLLPGEGVLGPAQAFLQAGSAAVLASYWRIDDARTASFMQKFYTHLFAEHLPAAVALRRAQLEAARTSSPHYWAAFALYGWPDSSM